MTAQTSVVPAAWPCWWWLLRCSGQVPLVRTNSDHLCSSGSSFLKIQHLFHIRVLVSPPACSFISCSFGSIFRDAICKWWRLKGHCGVQKHQVCGSGRFSLASSQAGAPHGCFTQTNISDLHLLKGRSSSLVALPLPPGIPTAISLHNILFPAVCSHKPFKATKRRENWEEVEILMTEGWKTHL